jgi:hypothetical protein
MTNLIFHIGLGKCASSTIQNQVLRSIPGYLGTASSLENENFAQDFKKFIPIDFRLKGNFNLAKTWANKIQRFQESKNPGLNRYILSSEYLTQPNKIHNRPIIPFLKQFSEEIWTNGKVKILLILRNQPEKLASAYAQRSNKIFGASQAHFEKYVNRIISKKTEKINWALWVEEIYQAFGSENVCVLLMEDIQSFYFWQKLKEFLELEVFDPNQMIQQDSTRANVRRTKGNVWKLRPYDFQNKSKVIADKVIGIGWPPSFLPKTREKARKGVQTLTNSFNQANPARLKDRKREEIIELTPELRQKILEYCRPFNERLSELLQRDLRELGY